MKKPSPAAYPAFFKNYVDQVPEEELAEAFANQIGPLTHFLESISEQQSTFAYAPGKWTIKEVLQHMTDTERIFNYRALCIARQETASLPGFDENTYAANSNANARSWNDLVAEFLAVRRSTDFLYKSFTPHMLETSGTASNKTVSVGSLGFISVGHCYHHIRVLKERYLAG